jgi:hypothetical protein
MANVNTDIKTIIEADTSHTELLGKSFEPKDFPLQFKLKYPVTIGDSTLSTITVHRMPNVDVACTVQDNIPRVGEGSATIVGIEKWTGVDESNIRQMQLHDFNKISVVMQSFL